MSTSQIEIQLIAMVTAAACALPGVFLVLQRKTMLSDAISHTVLLGIVIGFFVVQDFSSPILILGAAAVGVLTVTLVALVERTQRVKEDAAIGLVFPALFALAVILISLFAGDIHLDVDAVLLGEIAFAPFDRIVVFGSDIGPRGLYVMGGILLINLIFILGAYKELKLTTFDAALAASLGFSPVLLHYLLMGLVSVTVVGAFDIVGSVLVVALIVTPPATASLLTTRLDRLILISLGIGSACAVGGYWVAYALDVSISGAMVVLAGLVFFMVFLFAPDTGMVAGVRRQRRQKRDFALIMLTAHLLNHEHTPEAVFESRVDHLGEHMRWSPAFSQQVIVEAAQLGLVQRQADRLVLTDAGRQRASQEFTQ